ncbi:septation ring formation regulator EzrA [Weissella soli]|uniref:septation ring formation regulator EzrA n=1 Tax=Weissella soli TaxID=155866 RepID=UPI0011BBF8EF|nr:septation ring formation regulator EzrA [Weissella soli]QEA35131.1 septation ring formation regulator EzrA [Weissella soli]
MANIGHVVIGLIIVGAVAYMIIFLAQQIIARQVAKLIIRLEQLKNIPVRDRLVDGRKMSLTGKSLKQFEALEAKYTKLEMTGFEAIKKQADQVLFDSQGINFVKSTQSMKVLRQMEADASKDIDIVQQGMNDLEQLDREHKQAVLDLEAKYKELRKILLSQSFKFGPALDKLEEILGALEEDFSEFARMTEEGDHAAAADIHETLAMETNQLEERIAQIPALYEDLNEKIPAQLAEISEVYTAMAAKGFRFEEDFVEPALADLQKQRKIGLDLLQALTLKKVNDQLKGLHESIEYLYATLEKEAKAQQRVAKQLSELLEFKHHVSRQNHDLKIELDRMNQDFVFNKNEFDQVQTWTKQIHNVTEHLNDVTREIETQELIYSTVENGLNQDQDLLTAVEHDQVTMWDNLQKLPAIVKVARTRVTQHDEKMRLIQRRVERQNLPGIPTAYVDFYNSVNEELGRLMQQLDATRINIDDAQRQLSIVSADLDNLEERTNRVLEDADLTVRLVRKAFMFQDNQEVQQAVKEAKYYYEQSYDYESATRILGDVLDQIEPGTVATLRHQFQTEVTE